MSPVATTRRVPISHVVCTILLVACMLLVPAPSQAAQTLRTMRVSGPRQVSAAQTAAEESSVRDDKVNELVDLLRQGVASHQETIDVSSAGATVDEAKVACGDIIYDPAIYTLASKYAYSYSGDGTVKAITLTYAVDVAELDSWEEKAEAKVAEALTWVDDTMTDAQKAQALHDYLVRNCTYDQDVSDDDDLPFTALGALVNGTAVCQGYSDAYSLLLSRAGIDSEYVASDSMNHGWNMVQIEGSWYHVDVTWDDPIVNGSDQGFDAAVSHEFFLKGDSTLTSLEHHDWTAKHTAPSDYDMEYAIYEGPIANPVHDLAKASVSIEGDATYTGEAIGEDTIAVVVTYQDVTLTEGTDYDLTYQDNVNAGTATVTVTGKGTYSGTTSATFEIIPADITDAAYITTDSTGLIYDGTAKEPTATVVMEDDTRLRQGVDFTMSYRDNVDAGKATMVIVGTGNYEGTINLRFTIVPANLSDAQVTLSDTDLDWTGSALTPEATVTLDGKTLVAGTDYDISYRGNVGPGIATVTATGKGNYKNTATATFDITRDISGASVSAPDQAWTGEEVRPDVTVTIDGETLPTDAYDVSYADNVELGTATVTVKGKDHYLGTATGSFEIVPADISQAEVSVEDQEWTGQALEPEVTVTLGNRTLQAGADYYVSYESNVEPGTATVTVTGKGYYVGTVTATFGITRDISGATVAVADQTWTGSALEPEVTVTLDGETLPADAYEVSYADNVEVGTATVTVTGKGNYSGTATTTFEIAVREGPTPDDPDPVVATCDMYRLYNPNSGEHFYTANASERDNLVRVGWRYEGVGWTAPVESATPVYRLYSGTDHHYTTSASERDWLVTKGWRFEGIGWYSDDNHGVPLYRQYNPNVNPRAARNNSGSHNYTASKDENDWLVSLGWRAEGIGWYGVKE